MNQKLWIVYDTVRNVAGRYRRPQITYISEAADWAIKFITSEWAQGLLSVNLMSARSSTSPFGLRNQIVHYGSINVFLNRLQRPASLHPSNKHVVVTWFHVIPQENRWSEILNSLERAHMIHVACAITRNTLIKNGVPAEKIRVIPIGVNAALFHPVSAEEKIVKKKKLGIKEGAFVIGSFQKDGEGWGEGMTPKLIKGPDIFVKTIRQVSANHPVHVILAGPARGYVKAGLDKIDVPYTDMGHVDYQHQIHHCYAAVDAYLMTSRIEGGPMQFLESWASGVPFVGTRCGMVPDLAKDSQTALLADVEDSDTLARHMERLITEPGLALRLSIPALNESKKYGWSVLAHHYYQEIYKPFLAHEDSFN